MENLAAVSHSAARLSAVAPSVRRAGPGDFGALARLINRVYAVESFFVDGDRTNEAEVRTLAGGGHFLILDGAAGELAAAVFVRVDGDVGYFGMLSVAPDFQGCGLGTRMVAVAEAMCVALGCRAMTLQIVDLRIELGPWYRRLGYRETGTTPYDHRPAKRPCHFVHMEKALA